MKTHLPYYAGILIDNYNLPSILNQSFLKNLYHRLDNEPVIMRDFQIDINNHTKIPFNKLSKLANNKFYNLEEELDLLERFKLKCSIEQTNYYFEPDNIEYSISILPYLNNKDIYFTEEANKIIYAYGQDKLLNNRLDKAILIMYYYYLMGYEEDILNFPISIKPLSLFIYYGDNFPIQYLLNLMRDLDIKIAIYNLANEPELNKILSYIKEQTSIEKLLGI